MGLTGDQARALEGIGRCYLRDGSRTEGAAYLSRALAIYQRIGAADARRVKETRPVRMTILSSRRVAPCSWGTRA